MMRNSRILQQVTFTPCWCESIFRCQALLMLHCLVCSAWCGLLPSSTCAGKHPAPGLLKLVKDFTLFVQLHTVYVLLSLDREVTLFLDQAAVRIKPCLVAYLPLKSFYVSYFLCIQQRVLLMALTPKIHTLYCLRQLLETWTGTSISSVGLCFVLLSEHIHPALDLQLSNLKLIP